MSALTTEDLPEDMLRDIRDEQVKERKAMESLARAVLNMPPVENHITTPPANPTPVKNVIQTAKGWHFHWVKSDPDGNVIAIFDCTATPTT